jgi:hypothetical protein
MRAFLINSGAVELHRLADACRRNSLAAAGSTRG